MATAQFRFDTPQLAAGSFIYGFIKKIPDNKYHASCQRNPGQKRSEQVKDF
jgi:hypothetical protein